MHIKTIEIRDIGAVSATLSQAHAEARAPDFVACHVNADVMTTDLLAPLAESGAALHGATSCKGSVTEASDAAPAPLTAFCIWDEDGDYGTAMARFTPDTAAEAARAATRLALENADRQGEKPALVILSATPGQEEAVLSGIMAVVGRDVPIFGGTAADNTVSSGWAVTDGSGLAGQGVVVSVLFPSTQIHFAYHNGYAPNGHSGRVTHAEGRRLYEIDAQPAADVYQDWTAGRVLPAALGSEHNILAEATMAPLGQFLHAQDGIDDYLLLHPAQLHADGSLGLFAEISEGQTLTQMVGDRDTLSQRAGRVAAQAAAVGRLAPQDIAGAYMIYCGGCLLAVEDRVSTILDGVKSALPDAPFQGAFTFGEQGQVRTGQNLHGNLMISCVVFTTKPN